MSLSKIDKAWNKFLKESKKVPRGQKISETKKFKKQMQQEFPMGEFVSEKYMPKSVGIIAGHPFVKRTVIYDPDLDRYMDNFTCEVMVLWMSHPYHSGESVRMYYKHIKRSNIKKVLETEKEM